MMNDEIKIRHELNILSNTILDDTTYKPTISRRKLLLNYITNLQQKYEEADYDRHKLFEENERLKELNAELKAITKRPTPIDYAMIQKRYEDYKFCCEKAIEYIKENQEEEYVTGRPMLSYWAIDNLLNILQNGSDTSE